MLSLQKSGICKSSKKIVEIKSNAFSGTALNILAFLEKLEKIEDSAFANIWITVVELGNIKSIGKEAFSGCPMSTEIKIPGTLASIGVDAFRSCQPLKKIKFLDGVKIITNAFKDCTSLQEVEDADSVIVIGDRAFDNCGMLSSVKISPTSQLEEIQNSFIKCYLLEEITLLKTLKTIGSRTFYETGLRFLKLRGSINSIILYGGSIPLTCKII